MNIAGLSLLKSFEGCKLNAYLCPAGVPTIGYGFTREVNLGDSMTQDDADRRLQMEVADFESGVLSECAVVPSENELAALTCLAYNIGLGAFRKSTVLRRHNAGEKFAAANAFLMWNKSAGREMAGLTRRRESERALYLET